MSNEEIIAAVGIQPTEHSCPTCRNMCKTPCLGTPDDIFNLIEAGYTDRLAPTAWAVGVMVGTHTEPVPMLQAIQDHKTGFCTFYKDGLCELHNLGLKPLEGRLASCQNVQPKTVEELKKTALYAVVKEWEGYKFKYV